MGYKLKIHPCDLQDKVGFLRFLSENAANGLDAVWIFKNFSIFKAEKASEANRYIMLFPCASGIKDNLCVLNNDLGIFRAKGDAVPPGDKADAWETALLQHYPAFIGRTRRWVIRWSLTLCLLVILCILLARRVYGLSYAMAMSAPAILRLMFPRASRNLTFSIIGLLCFSLFTCFWEWRIDGKHKTGLSQAAACGVPYRQPPSQDNLIYTKNLLCTLRVFLAPVICLLLLYLLV